MSLVAAPAVRRQAYDIRPFVAGWCIYGLLLALFGWLLLGSSSAASDVRSFYAAGYLCRTHPAALYDLQAQQEVQNLRIQPADKVLPFFHPAYEALLFVPFSYLPYHTAYFAFMVSNLIMLLAIFLADYGLFAESIPLWGPRPGLMLLPYTPLLLALWRGQDTLVYLLVCTLTWRWLKQDRDVLAGAVLALGLFRFQLAIPLALLLIARRGWRFAAGFLGAGTALGLLSAAVVGRQGTAMLLRLLTMAGNLTGVPGVPKANVVETNPRSMPDLFGLLYGFTSHLPPVAGLAVVLAVSLIVFGGCMYVVRKTPQEPLAFSVAVVCSALVSYHMYLYSMAVLLIPVALLGSRLRKGVLLAFYVTPLVVTLLLGRDWLFLLALPTLALLWDAVRLDSPAVTQPSAA